VDKKGTLKMTMNEEEGSLIDIGRGYLRFYLDQHNTEKP
jgi:hypothetical protein